MYISRHTGLEISEYEHVLESITDILTTRYNTRIIRGEYGCGVFDLIDQPINTELIMDLRIAVVTALDRWEPRVKIEKVTMDLSDWIQGKLSISLEGIYKPTGKPISFTSLQLRYRSIVQ